MTRALPGQLAAWVGLVWLATHLAPVQAQAGEAANADTQAGLALYQEHCSGCHSPDGHRVGPAHRGVVGRPAGTAPGYDYSPALRRAGLVWTPENLDAWLREPEALVPGQKMFYQVEDAQDRRLLIAYLQTLKP